MSTTTAEDATCCSTPSASSTWATTAESGSMRITTSAPSAISVTWLTTATPSMPSWRALAVGLMS